MQLLKSKMIKSREELLEEMFFIIRANPGIRPSELNHRLGLLHSADLREALIKRGLIKKEKKGNAIYYYPV